MNLPESKFIVCVCIHTYIYTHMYTHTRIYTHTHYVYTHIYKNNLKVIIYLKIYLWPKGAQISLLQTCNTLHSKVNQITQNTPTVTHNYKAKEHQLKSLPKSTKQGQLGVSPWLSTWEQVQQEFCKFARKYIVARLFSHKYTDLESSSYLLIFLMKTKFWSTLIFLLIDYWLLLIT